METQDQIFLNENSDLVIDKKYSLYAQTKL